MSVSGQSKSDGRNDNRLKVNVRGDGELAVIDVEAAQGTCPRHRRKCHVVEPEEVVAVVG